MILLEVMSHIHPQVMLLFLLLVLVVPAGMIIAASTLSRSQDQIRCPSPEAVALAWGACEAASATEISTSEMPPCQTTQEVAVVGWAPT